MFRIHRSRIALSGLLMTALLAAVSVLDAAERDMLATVDTIPMAPSPEVAADPLTGLPVEASLTRRPLLAVMVENSPAARPQSGLDRAGVVIETVVEGGITRFMALFAGTDADVIGPVRSARQYFASWAFGFEAFLGHCFAKPTGYDTIRRLHVMNLDAVRVPKRTGLFWRTKSRKAPHNLYGGTMALRDYGVEKKSYSTVPARPLWRFKDEAARGDRGDAHAVDIHFSNKRYDVRFIYDPERNRYLRELAGRPHLSGSERATAPVREVLRGAMHTKASATQLAPINVVIVVTRWRRIEPGSPILEMRVTGGGEAIFLRDGHWTAGTWIRDRESDPLALLDADGSPIALNRGRTWIAVVRRAESVALVVEEPAEP